MAGYSGTPLIKKLGIKPGFKCIFIAAPGNYLSLLGELPQPIEVKKRVAGQFDFIHYFATKQVDLGQQYPRLKKALKQDGMIWISWPKKTAPRVINLEEADLDENHVRSLGLRAGLVDIKVCAIDEIWSGLKFVIPLKDRK